MAALSLMSMALPTASSLLSAYASLSTSVMIFRTTFTGLVPQQLQDYILNAIRSYWKPHSSKICLIINRASPDNFQPNLMYDAAETYLATKIISQADNFKIAKTLTKPELSVFFSKSQIVTDEFEGIKLTWTYECKYSEVGPRSVVEERSLQLSFSKNHKDKVMDSYLPYVTKRAEEIKAEKKTVKLHSIDSDSRISTRVTWKSVNMVHPTTFDKLAMETELKKEIMNDLDLFIKRKEYYQKVGKAWKRGYLLYGPPGTGKSSLIAAIANYLKFDVYDLQLANVTDDSHLRSSMMSTQNRSILVIEDIDCSTELPDRNKPATIPFDISTRSSDKQKKPQFSLSGLLNFLDGLWSCCGDSRIIIFTTNNKEKLDPALLRPGRMDVHIHMSYITMNGFKTLAANYLGIHDYDDDSRFGEIKELIENVNATPAEVAGELMKSADSKVALEGVVNFLKSKKTEEDNELKRKKTEDDELKRKMMEDDETKKDIEDGGKLQVTNRTKKFQFGKYIRLLPFRYVTLFSH